MRKLSDNGVGRREGGGKGGLPNNPGVDVALGDDKTIKQDGAEQHEHAQAIGQHNVARDHCYTAEEGHSHLMRHKNDCPVHEEPALQHCHTISIVCAYNIHNKACRVNEEESALQRCLVSDTVLLPLYRVSKLHA